tara:strand:+ start:229 stop:852 length:624 start_codon:yes stop_codon:yes gene_type:complete
MAGADDAQLKDFQGLPISELIVDPLVSASAGQKKLAGVTLDFVSSIGFEPDPDDPKKTRTRTIDVEVERLIKGRTTPQKQMVKMPLLSMVTIPNLSISDVKIHFDMEVKSHSENKDSHDNKQEDHSETEGHAEVSGHFWGIGVTAGGSHSSSHTGTVTSHSENTRSTDFSARYSIDVEAKQNPPAEGLARFTQMLASTLEPVDTQAK